MYCNRIEPNYANRILESHKQLAPTCTICANDKQRRHIQTVRECEIETVFKKMSD